MTPELTALALAGLLHIVQFAVASVMANSDLGTGYTTSPRDRPPSREMRLTTERMLRAYDNHTAMIGLFAAGIVVVTMGDQTTFITILAAYSYVGFRALYIPAYTFGWRPWRSLLWVGAMTCCATLFLAALI